jgi:hypothetical protein
MFHFAARRTRFLVRFVFSDFLTGRRGRFPDRIENGARDRLFFFIRKKNYNKNSCDKA